MLKGKSENVMQNLYIENYKNNAYIIKRYRNRKKH